jgi:hypothetical protein
MNREDIIRMAREAGFDTDLPPFKDGTAIALKLAKLVAQYEREACAKVCEDSVEYAGDTLAETIRARGQA